MASIRYYWLGFQIILFYIFVAYGISLWGAYICWAQEEEENLAQAALQYKYHKMATGVDQEAQMKMLKN